MFHKAYSYVLCTLSITISSPHSPESRFHPENDIKFNIINYINADARLQELKFVRYYIFAWTPSRGKENKF